MKVSGAIMCRSTEGPVLCSVHGLQLYVQVATKRGGKKAASAWTVPRHGTRSDGA